MAYLVVLFQILTDLFRDKAVSGWFKAIWVLFLIIFPLLTSLIYLIARGQGMAERHVSEAQAAQADADAYIRSVATTGSPAEEIAKAKALHDSGAINDEEYASLKAKALA